MRSRTYHWGPFDSLFIVAMLLFAVISFGATHYYEALLQATLAFYYAKAEATVS